MNRTQKKCMIASAGLHLTLLLVLFIGPAFLPSSDSSREIHPIDFVPVRIIEGAMAGGGNPNANPPPPAPPAPTPPAPTPVQPQKLEQPKEPVKETPKQEPQKPDKSDFTLTTKPQKTKPQVNLTLTDRKTVAKNTTKATASSDTKADAKRNADQIGRAVAGLRNNLAPTTSIDLRGPGGGGETYAGVEQAILSIYDRVWDTPEGMDSSEAVVEVSVTIEADGTVSSSRIVKRSGDARVDRSVQQALNRVTSIPGWDGKKRTVEFSFKSRAKEII